MQRWVIPPEENAAFAAAMEEVLAVYARPPDARFPLVCFDEAGKELTAHTRPPLPARPGQPAREDAEYGRAGKANLFLACAPHLGWRQMTVTERRTGVDFAHALRALVDQAFPAAERIVLVLDNLNTHRPAALYQAFAPQEARRILERIEWHCTPVHGSWLNIAELEWSVLTRQCLDRRLPTQAVLAQEVAAWVATRNRARARVAWRFTVADARTKLAHVYPIPEPDTVALTHYLIRLRKPAISDPVVEERAYGAVTENDLDVVPADGITPPLVVDIPGILDALDHMAPVALVQRDRQPTLSVDCDLNWTRKVQASYAISACLRSGRRDHGSTSATQ